MSDNQVTEPSETACFCKHGNLGQHESDCPKCPLHFTRGELNALQRERDQLRAELAKVREERDQTHNANKKLKFGWQRIGDQFKGGNGPRECFRFQAAAKKNEGEVVGTILDCIFGIWDDLAKAEKQNAALTDALDKAREDSKRLDWLASNATSELKIDSNGTFVWLDQWRQKYTSFYQWSGPTLRAAIDAAALAQP